MDSPFVVQLIFLVLGFGGAIPNGFEVESILDQRDLVRGKVSSGILEELFKSLMAKVS